jgi:hypothetical protein
LKLRRNALFGPAYELVATGGYAESPQGAALIAKGFGLTGEASIEMSLTPERDQEAGLLSLPSETGGLFLSQRGADLVLNSRIGGDAGDDAVWKQVLKPGKRHHLLLTLSDSTAELYVDGKSCGRRDFAMGVAPGGFSNLIVGDVEGGWAGQLENLGIYNRLMSPAEITASMALAAPKQRQAPPVLALKGQLMERSEIPAPEDLGAYSRALVVNTYSVDNLIRGKYGDDRVLVAEWAVLDRQIIKEYREPVETEELLLQRFEDNPQLEGERLMMDIFEPDLEMYYRLPARPGRH